MIFYRSTTTNLLFCLNHLSLTFDLEDPVDVLYLIFPKPSTKFPNIDLFLKLDHLEICGELNSWLCNYLYKTTFSVRTESDHSFWHQARSGVPQGSVLALLFLLYLADLDDLITISHSFYTDDTKLYENPLEQHDIVQSNLL